MIFLEVLESFAFVALYYERDKGYGVLCVIPAPHAVSKPLLGKDVERGGRIRVLWTEAQTFQGCVVDV